MAIPTRPQRPVPHSLDALSAALHAAGVAVDLVDPDAGPAVAVTGMTLSTQRVLPGDLYAAVRGTRAHGASYAPEALASGAVAVLTDPDGLALLPDGTRALVVADPRAVLGDLAAEIYGRPAEDLFLIGVTGTQGKTTSTRLLESALTTAGVRAAAVGTVGTRILGEDVPTALTTPEAPDLHGLFAAMREQAVEVCVLEVSSHALVLGRVGGVVFDLAVFTNLGRDHLDFHADFEEYYAAKASLFDPERARRGLVNLDDPHGRRLLAEARIPMRTFGFAEGADWRAVDLELRPDGSSFTVLAPDGGRIAAGVRLAGDFNVANALAAIAAGGEAGHDPAVVAAALAQQPGVPGRLERVDAGAGFEVIVDYAHKPDALAAALTTLRPLARGRLICVLGAGGNRDAGKRPVMGEIVASLADIMVVTDDNPRGEEPAAIRAAVLAGARGGRAQVHEEGDRRAAIRLALGTAGPGDIVLIAGKGHETGQEVAGVVHPFDDRVVAREELARQEPAREDPVR